MTDRPCDSPDSPCVFLVKGLPDEPQPSTRAPFVGEKAGRACPGDPGEREAVFLGWSLLGPRPR